MTTWDWMADAVCRDHDPELFHPPEVRPGTSGYDAQVAEALAVCQGCPVAGQCLDYAYRSGDRWAVLGNTAPHGRRQARGPRTRTCHRCDTSFLGNARYCSPACRNAAYRDRQRAEDLAEHLPTIARLSAAGASDQQIADYTGLRRGQVQYLRDREGYPAGRAPGGAGRWPRTGVPA